MGVLDIPTHRLLIREAAAHDVLHAEEYIYEDENQHDESQNERPRRQKTPKLGRKTYGHHDVKRGNGVRRKRRNDNLFFLYSLVDGLNPEEIQDEDEMNMTTFGELFVDPTKMKVWAEFVNMTEEDQEQFLQSAKSFKHNSEQNVKINEAASNDNPDFDRIQQNLKHFFRSEQLSKEILAQLEDDLIFAFNECQLNVVLLDIPSSFERMMVHGLAQYMQLQSHTHKIKKKHLMEVENVFKTFSPPYLLLTDYLETFDK